MNLSKIEYEKFLKFLEKKFDLISDRSKELSEGLLKITDCHPYYTQQLAFTIWERLNRNGYSPEIIKSSAEEIVLSHDNDYERLWNNFNRTDMMVLNGMTVSDISPLSDEFSKLFGTGAVSTVFSTLKRLTQKGILIREGSIYKIDDPFFKMWIIKRRGM